MIKVENLIKHYGLVKAVQSINFDVQDGEILGFLGANGAGKSTTLKVMTTFLSPTSGNVFVDNLNILDHSLEIRKKIGYLPELNPLYADLKVYDLLKFVANVRGIHGKAFRNALARVIEQTALSGVVHKTVSALSKGYKQRLGLAIAIIHNPKILILDEPVTGLDPNQIVEIRNLIKELGREKMVIISSHILQEIEATVDRIIIIDNGKLVANGTSEELKSQLSGKVQLTLEVTGANDDQLGQFTETFASFNPTFRTKENRHIISLEYEKTSDPRPDVFNFVKDENWGLLVMNPHRVELEDVFRNLTGKGALA